MERRATTASSSVASAPPSGASRWLGLWPTPSWWACADRLDRLGCGTDCSRDAQVRWCAARRRRSRERLSGLRRIRPNGRATGCPNGAVPRQAELLATRRSSAPRICLHRGNGCCRAGNVGSLAEECGLRQKGEPASFAAHFCERLPIGFHYRSVASLPFRSGVTLRDLIEREGEGT
jgi:hypothetical protein